MRLRHIALTLLMFCGTTAMQCREAADIIEQYGFTTLKPPSTLYFVGAIVAVNVGADGKLETGSLKLSCPPRASLGHGFSPISSHTVSESMRRSSRSKWQLGGDLMSEIRASGNGDNIESIEVVLNNASIVNISDTDLLENLANRSEDCKRAISARLRAGYSLTMISSALVADLTYNVKFKSETKIDMRARAKQMSALAVQLGGGQTRMSEKTIESRGLTLGIKTDSFLMALSLPPNSGVDLAQMLNDDDDRSIHMSEAKTSVNTDSPVVLPGGSYVMPVFSPEN